MLVRVVSRLIQGYTQVWQFRQTEAAGDLVFIPGIAPLEFTNIIRFWLLQEVSGLQHSLVHAHCDMHRATSKDGEMHV